jgi:Glycine rich protein
MKFRLSSALVVAVAAALLALPGAALAIAPPATFMSTGAEQSYAVPSGVQLVAVEAQGAWGVGAVGGPGHYSSGFAQNSAAWQGLLTVAPGQTLYAEVGSNGSAGGGPTFGGGGAAGSANPEGAEAGSGGGASDIRTCSELAASCPGGGSSAASRVMVAGGSGGNGGSGITTAAGLFCGSSTGGGAAANEQPLPNGNAALGPVPIPTAAGLVIPGYATATDPTAQTVQGMTDAGGGSDVAGAGGSGTSCGGGGAYQGDTFSGSVAGSSGSGSNGGRGGDAAGLAPIPCNTPGECSNAGPGGGGGGGYFGGGGGATGFNTCTGTSGSCGNITASLGGGAGSSFIANSVLYPSSTIIGGLGTGVPYIRIAPVIEIDVPANGAVYSPGQVLDAGWSCSTVPGWGFGAQNCAADAANGSPINTTPGTHTFTVNGIARNNSEPVSASVTYTVASGAGSGSVGAGAGRTAHGALAGLTFSLAGPGTCLAPGGTLRASLARGGSSKSYRPQNYSYYIDRGTAHRKHLIVNGKRRTVTVYGPTLVTSSAGPVSLSINKLKPGTHTLKLVILLRAVSAHHKPKTRTLTLRLSFVVC